VRSRATCESRIVGSINVSKHVQRSNRIALKQNKVSNQDLHRCLRGQHWSLRTSRSKTFNTGVYGLGGTRVSGLELGVQ
jgi:hypothetical protein